MPVGPERIAAFLHPVAALLALGLLAWVASLGLRARERGGAPLRARHARLAPWAYGLVLLNVAGGWLSTRWLRPDLADASSAHLGLGLVIAALLTVGAVLSRHLDASPFARRLHPIAGMVALLLSALQVFLGLGLLPL